GSSGSAASGGSGGGSGGSSASGGSSGSGGGSAGSSGSGGGSGGSAGGGGSAGAGPCFDATRLWFEDFETGDYSRWTSQDYGKNWKNGYCHDNGFSTEHANSP